MRGLREELADGVFGAEEDRTGVDPPAWQRRTILAISRRRKIGKENAVHREVPCIFGHLMDFAGGFGPAYAGVVDHTKDMSVLCSELCYVHANSTVSRRCWDHISCLDTTHTSNRPPTSTAVFTNVCTSSATVTSVFTNTALPSP